MGGGIARKFKGIFLLALVSLFVSGTAAAGSKKNKDLPSYKSDFKAKDISIPKGTNFKNNRLEITDKADPVVRKVMKAEVAESPVQAATTEQPDIQQQYLQQSSLKSSAYNNYDYASQYNEETAASSSDKLKKVVEYGKPAFTAVVSVYKGDYGKAFSAAKEFLGAFGIIGGGEGVSNEQILMEVQRVYSAVQELSLEVKDIQGLLSVMSNQLDETTMQAYRNGLQSFDNAMSALDTDAEILQQMLVTGAEILQQSGTNAPAADAAAEDMQAYVANLISTIEDNQKNNPDLKNFDGLMQDLMNNYTLVATELAKSKDFSPLSAYDKYWNQFFNWESQGYALRAAYRANAEFQVKRAYSIIALYYNIGTGNTVMTYQKYGQLLRDALTQIEANGPGVSPEDVLNSREWCGNDFTGDYPQFNYNLEGGLYTSTFDKRLTELWLIGNVWYKNHKVDYNIRDDIEKMSEQMPKELVQKYAAKLHGKSLEDELILAGFWKSNDDDDYKYKNTCSRGFAFNIKKDGKDALADMIYYDGTYHEKSYIRSFKKKKGDICAVPGGLPEIGDDYDEDEFIYYTHEWMFNLH